jgi:hypothetical protein
VISSIKLRLVPRTRLKRTVKVTDIEELIPAFEQRIKQGYWPAPGLVDTRLS